MFDFAVVTGGSVGRMGTVIQYFVRKVCSEKYRKTLRQIIWQFLFSRGILLWGKNCGIGI